MNLLPGTGILKGQGRSPKDPVLTVSWGEEKELPQASRTTYMKNSEHRVIASNISHKRKEESVWSFI